MRALVACVTFVMRLRSCDAYLDAILRQTSRPFQWGQVLTNNVLGNGNRVIIAWDLGQDEKKKVGWWLCQCVEFYRNASRHQNSLYMEAHRRKENLLKSTRSGSVSSDDNVRDTAFFQNLFIRTQQHVQAPSSPADCLAPEALPQRRQSGSCGSDLVVPVDSVEALGTKLREYKERVACVICPFGQSETLNDQSCSWEQFMAAPHIVRLVQEEMAKVAPQFRCPFIVYANPRKDKRVSRWRQECSMRCGALGFASRTDELFEYLKRVTDVYLPSQ